MTNTTALGGMPAVRFAGTGDGLGITGLNVTHPYTIFIVDQYYGGLQARTLQSSTGANWLMGKWGGGNANFVGGWVTVAGGHPAGIDAPVIGEAVGAATDSHYFINGRNRSNNASVAGVPSGLGLGAAGTFNEQSEADVAEILVYDSVLSKADRNAVGLYLANKYGLVSQYKDPSTFANFGTMAAFSGADGGEGLDLDGNLVYAINAGGPHIPVGGRVFTPDTATPGVTLTANNIIPFWDARPEYGASAADEGLESVMHGIRWSGAGNPISDLNIELDVTAGETYKLQLMFSENINGRGPGGRVMDISVNGQQQLDQLMDVNVVTGHAANAPLVQGAVFTYEFTASSNTATVQITAPNLGIDSNPAINALTLENLSLPAPPSAATTTTVSTYSGADAGEGLDLSGVFKYAVNINGSEQTVGDATFAANDAGNPAGVTILAQNIIGEGGWGGALNYGDSADDDALEVINTSIRWSALPNEISVQVDDLDVGQEYKLQMIFQGTGGNRGFDVFVGGELVADEFTTQQAANVGVVITHEFVADHDSLVFALGGFGADPGSFSDRNPILNAFTLEVVPEPSTAVLCLLAMAGLGLCRRRQR